MAKKSIRSFLESYTENMLKNFELIKGFEIKKFGDLHELKIVSDELKRSINHLEKIKELLENLDIYRCDKKPIIRYPFAAKWVLCGKTNCKCKRTGLLHGPYLFLVRGKRWISQGRITERDINYFLEGLPYKILIIETFNRKPIEAIIPKTKKEVIKENEQTTKQIQQSR